MPLGYLPDPLPPAKGLDSEDNYQILVYDREGGDLLGVALKTSMSGVAHHAMQDAVEAYPGKYLVETNSYFIIRAVTAPTGTPDQFGWIECDDMVLEHLPQWYDLVARCACGYLGLVDRYDPRVMRWKSYPLSRTAEKLSCDDCTRAGRPRQKIKIGLRKLPR